MDRPAPSSALRPRPAAWPYRADPPQRYWGNYERYQQRGGLVDLEADIAGFVGHGNVGDISRFYFFCLAFDQIRKEGVAGDLAELGVYRGETAGLLARMARRLGRTAWLLDTFGGFDAADLTGIDGGQRKQFADTSLEAVRALVGEEATRFIQGHFPASAAQLPEARYCLVHIDCDLYAPISAGLSYFYPRLEPGGFLIIHDYSSLAWEGAEKAVDDFFADKPESVMPLPDGCGSAVIRKLRPVQPAGKTAAADLDLSWTRAQGEAIRSLLGPGWSGFESWGIWGIGPAHELRLRLPAGASGCVLECDVELAIAVTPGEHFVDVMISDRPVARWQFSAGANRGVRRAVLPPIPADGRVVLRFRPQATFRPCDHDPSKTDTRPLGMALHGLRLAS
ncbi:MAG: TylF/MycF/NovP-related O-methyltransferase [Acetobacteraceae bacterium]